MCATLANLPKHDVGNSIEVLAMDVRWLVSIWKIMLSPHDIQMEDKKNIFFDTIMGVSSMRYFIAKGIALDHRERERVIIVFVMNNMLIWKEREENLH